MRRAAAVVTVLFGLWLVSLPFAFDLFDRTSNAEKVTDAFRSTLSARGIADLSANYGVIRGFGNQFVNETRPALAKQLGLSQAQFDRFVGANFPAVAAAVKGVPGAIALVDPVVPQLARLSGSGDFRKVDDIPGLGLPITVIPWLLLGLGAAAAGFGAVGLWRGSRWAIMAGGGIAAATVIAALALDLPAKFQATSRTVEVGRVALSQKAADTATQTVAVVDATVKEVQAKLVPALATRLGTTPAAVKAEIATQFPDVATGLAQWPRIKPGAADLAARQRATVAAFAAGDGAPFRTLPWLVIGPALLAALLCGAALVRRPRELARGDVPAGTATA